MNRRGDGLAPCRLLAEASGVDTTAERGEVDFSTRSWCDRLEDHACSTCPLFFDHVDWVTHEQPHRLKWVCSECVDEDRDRVPAEGRLLGFYGDGLCDFCGAESIVLNAIVVDR